MRVAGCLAVLLAAALPAIAQGVVGEFMAGKLVEPKVGQWAWYDLTATGEKQKFVVRQAVVAEEKVDRDMGYWVEIEIVPQVGYKTVVKMLLTGPASDLRNIHKVIRKEGLDPAEFVELDAPPKAEDAEEPKAERQSKGIEAVETMSGPVRAEKFEVTVGEEKYTVWINELVKPTGIVRLRSPRGELILRNSGFGGQFAKSVLENEPDDKPDPGAKAQSSSVREADGKT